MDSIELLVLPERAVVLANQRTEVDVVVEIRCKRDPNKATAHALNLAIVIDRSGSMAGDKLAAAKQGCLGILKTIRPEDLFTVITFDDKAEVVVNPQISREAARAKIEAITDGGQTNLSLGWYLGLLELQTHATPEHYNRLLLLSDGQANAGETKQSVLAAEAAKSRDLGVTTSTVGIGDQFQEDLLEAIATESGGRFWYIKESRIDDIIKEEFQGSLSVVLDRPRLEIRLPPAVFVSRELNTLTRVSGKYRVRPLKGDDYFNFAVRLDIQSTGSETIPVTAVLYDGDVAIKETTIQLQRAQQSALVKAPLNPLVASVVKQYEVSITNEKVLANMANADLDLMKKLLITEVDGMRVVRDALEAEHEDARVRVELEHLSMEMAMKGSSIMIADILRDFTGEPEVADYIVRWRKGLMHNQHRMVRRSHDVEDFDEDLYESLVQGAIDLTEILSARFPERAATLASQQELLREQLARR